MDEHRDVGMNLNARMPLSCLKYMSQDEFQCNSVNCTRAMDAGYYPVVVTEMIMPLLPTYWHA